MASEFEKKAEAFLGGSGGKKLNEKRGEIQQLADSDDGRKVKSMLDENGSLQAAVEKGDVGALKNVLSQVLNTDEGARLAKRLSELMK